jgi:hypothetical protein
MNLKFPCSFLSLAIAVAAIVTPSPAAPADDASPLKVTAEIISQRYCPSNETTFTVIFKLRMHFMNQTDGKLIVDKHLGWGPYHIEIASDEKSYAERKFEYDPNGDFTVGHVPPETTAQFKSPLPNFAILAPGESTNYESDFWASLIGPLPGAVRRPEAIPPGNHVLAVWVSAWNHDLKAEEIHKQWESFGDLVYKSVRIGPLPFNLPPDPKIEKCPQ